MKIGLREAPVAIVAVNTRMLDQLQPQRGSVEGHLVQAVEFEAGHTLRFDHSEDPAPLPPPAAQAVAKSRGYIYPAVSLIGVALAGLLVPTLIDRGIYSSTAAAVTGISVFAGIYAVAQAIERLLEPLSHWLLSSETTDNAYGEAVEKADAGVTAWRSSPENAATRDAAETAMKDMAKAKNSVDERKDDRAAIFWAIASVLGMLASAQFGLFLLKLIGVSSSYGWDVFATGLILGAGTKPLHDLITNLSSGSPTDSSGGGSTTTTTN